MSLNFLDCFSGIGGFAYATQLTGLTIDNHYHSEIDEFSNSIYRRHYPRAIQLGDISRLDGNSLRREHAGAWLITGGFPCQDVSTAGKRKGLTTDTRTGLWHHMCRIIDELEPRYVLAENVRGLCSKGLDQVISDLAAIRYDAEWGVVRAADAGLPHNRQRIWIVAYPQSTRLGRNTESFTCSGDLEQSVQLNSKSNSLAIQLARARTKTIWDEVSQPYVSGIDDGLSRELHKNNRQRVKALGNAICPQVAAWVLNRMFTAA